MKLLSTLGLLSAAASVQAHYVFDKLIVNGVTTGQWQYVRATDNKQTTGPVTDVTSSTIRCYTSDTTVGSRTSVIDVAAGSTAPTGTSAANFQGDGNVWFKIAESGPTVTSGALPGLVMQTQRVAPERETLTPISTGKGTVSVTIPKCIPNGDYLLRVEHIALHSASAVNGAQFYLSCAQIRVTGGGSTQPPPAP
ncbi:unnamed protein product [Parascedosporium putredinis]|uniref:lytic cellulose monooxygenase (C4-dehydrogenating) n=1 Tax=Parascedosporium putredinis TaxID=1442378 RepID=A0A9P1M774_9PEZI|nr:unnamed protein product [Parascedosporium putredinis]CAI7991101.1 unnamed protein product [Parascedosporium putredinis]